MSAVDPRPDHGVPSVCTSAAMQIEGIASTLDQARTHADAQVALVGVDVWNGLAADAFRDSSSMIATGAATAVQAWGRLAAALTDYASQLTALQTDGDALRTRLSAAHDDLDQARQRQADAVASLTVGVGPGDGTTPMPGPNHAISAAETEIDAVNALLVALEESRHALDARAVEALRSAPGPGATAWSGIAYRADGSVRPVSAVTDTVLDRLLDGEITTEDYLLLARLLSMYSGDEAAMSHLYSELGAQDLTTVLTVLATVEDVHGDLPEGTAIADIAAQITAGLVTASRTWSPDEAQEFGADLVDAVDQNGSRPAVILALGAEGLNTEVALGAFDRLEDLRQTDPDAFALATGTAAQSGLFLYHLDPTIVDALVAGAIGCQGTLTGTVFKQIARDPESAINLLAGQPEVIDYWFGQHSWGDGFQGPATLLNAIAHDADLQAARAADPLGSTWRRAVGLLEGATEALGGNLNLRYDALSNTAARDLAEALATVVPEIAAGLGSGFIVISEEDVRVNLLSSLGSRESAAFDPQTGNLARLLGIALLDPAALATFTGATGAYATTVLDHVTGPGHPDLATAKALLDGVGSLYGLTHGSYTLQDNLHAAALSGQAEREINTVMTLSCLIPGISTGSAAADYLAQIAAGLGLDATAALDPRLMSQEDLDALLDQGTDGGRIALNSAITETLADRWDSILPGYTGTSSAALAAPTLTSSLEKAYSDAVTAATNENGDGAYEIRVPGEDKTRNPGDMP